MENIDFDQTNIFIRIQFQAENTNIFVYSNTIGMKYFQESSHNAMLHQLFSEKEIITKFMKNLHGDNLMTNDFTGVYSPEWYNKKIVIPDDEYSINIFHERYENWLENLTKLFGEGNFFIVEVDKKTVSPFLDCNQIGLLELLEAKRLSDKLQQGLPNKISVTKRKI